MRTIKLKIKEGHMSMQNLGAKLGGDPADCWTMQICNIPMGVTNAEVLRLAKYTTWFPSWPMGEDFKNLEVGKIIKTINWEEE